MAGPDFISATRLRELLSYDPILGAFTWAQDRGGRKTTGLPAGSSNPNGYIEITVDGGRYWAHRLAWFYVHGSWPLIVDHINGMREDNRIANLRDVSQRENSHNKPLTSRKNATGFIGVRRYGRGKYRSEIFVGEVRHDLGTFDSAEAAADAYRNAKERLHEPSFR